MNGGAEELGLSSFSQAALTERNPQQVGNDGDWLFRVGMKIRLINWNGWMRKWHIGSYCIHLQVKSTYQKVWLLLFLLKATPNPA